MLPHSSKIFVTYVLLDSRVSILWLTTLFLFFLNGNLGSSPESLDYSSSTVSTFFFWFFGAYFINIIFNYIKLILKILNFLIYNWLK